jgi:hypothetical protein
MPWPRLASVEWGEEGDAHNGEPEWGGAARDVSDGEPEWGSTA